MKSKLSSAIAVVAATTLAMSAPVIASASGNSIGEIFQNPTNSFSQKDEVTSTEIMEAVVFGEGELGKELDTQESFTPPAEAAVSERDKQILEDVSEGMRALPASFLDEQAEKITSGDPYQVERALDNYSNALLDVFDEEAPGVREHLAEDQVQPQCGAMFVCVAAMYVAIAAAFAVAAVAANVGGGYNALVAENGVWTGDTYTGARSANTAPLEYGETLAEEEISLDQAELVRTITTKMQNV